MKLGKLENGIMQIVEVEHSKELNGARSEDELVALGYEPLCETSKSSDDDVCEYARISNGWIQVWKQQESNE